MTDPAVQFDDSKAALSFALNASQVAPPGSVMNRMMAQVKVKPKKRRRKPTPTEEVFGVDPDSPEALLERENERLANPRRRDPGNRPRPLRGLDAAHQAGLILHHFAKLDLAHRIVLTGKLTRSHVPCSCRRPCCSGWSIVGQWRAAVHDACILLKDAQTAERRPGTKGFSTDPKLRELVVRDWFLGQESRLQELSDTTRVALTTVARHRGWIVERLDALEQGAWVEVDALFDREGITGAF